MLEEDFTAITTSPLINWQLFANANILITGANGFLPAYMAKTLLNLNTTLLKHSPCRVLALVRNYKHAVEVFAPYLDPTFTKDSVLGSHSADFGDFEATADHQSSSAPKSPKNYESNTAIPRILGEDKQAERENQATNEKVDSSNDYSASAECMDCHASTTALARNDDENATTLNELAKDSRICKNAQNVSDSLAEAKVDSSNEAQNLNDSAKDSRILELESGFFEPRKDNKTRGLLTQRGDEIHDSSPKAESPQVDSRINAKNLTTPQAAGFCDDFGGFQAVGAGIYLSGNEQAHRAESAKSAQKPTPKPESIRQDLVLITQDVSDPLSLPYPIHYIIHAASPASPRFYKDAPLSVIYPNVLGTINMLNLARTNPVRSILYFSSGEVYGEFAGEIDENAYGIVDPTALRSCYAESKRMGENLCIAYGSEYGLPVKIVRPFHTYGPGMKLDDGRVFADFVRSVVMGQDIVLTSSGEAKRSFLYLSDATLAYFLILTKGVNNEAYNVANEQGIISIKELAQIIVGLFPEKGLQVRFEPPKESYMPSPIMSCAVKTHKLKALGWSPKVSIEQGFSKTIRSYL